jgi:hypothetical protein
MAQKRLFCQWAWWWWWWWWWCWWWHNSDHIASNGEMISEY